MAVQMILRKAQEEDLQQILALEATAAEVSGGNTLLPWPWEFHLGQLHNPDARYLIAEDMQLNFLGYSVLSELSSPHRSAYLQRIVVFEPGQGIGKTLLEQVVAFAFDELKIHRLWTQAFVENDRAIKAYKRVGMKKEGVFRDAFIDETGQFRSIVNMSVLATDRQAQNKKR